MVYIYLHEWLIFMVHVGKYTSPMDPSWVLNEQQRSQQDEGGSHQPEYFKKR